MAGCWTAAGLIAVKPVLRLLQCFAMSFGLATSTFVAQNFGAGLHARVKQGVTNATVIVTVTAVIIPTITLLTRWQTLRVFLDVNQPGGSEALAIMSLCFIVLHILHVFRNVMTALGLSIWPMCSGFAEFADRILMARLVLPIIGPDALFIAEPASWFGAMLCVLLPYFHYRKTLLRTDKKTLEIK